MFKEYSNGRTPNPDVLCNREVKFDLFLKKALELGADYVATGHYCRKETLTENGKEIHRLLAGKDGTKDQSYFLCQINQKQLSKALFPIGGLKKTEVRALAKKIGLNTAEKKDSQGLCFIGKVKLPVFLQQQLKPRSGKVIEIDRNHNTFNSQNQKNSYQEYALAPQMGKVIGEHQGAHYYTIGQRKGLNIGGSAKPLFVLGINTEYNIIYVGQGEDHPGLYRSALKIENKDVHWVREDLQIAEGESASYHGRIRYRQALFAITLHQKKDALFIEFDLPKKAITPGQFAAWYLEDELIGSGIIAH